MEKPSPAIRTGTALHMKRFMPLAFALMLALSGCNLRVSTEAPKPLPPATAGTAEQTMAVFMAGKEVVHRIDDGKYDLVWEDSSAMMKNASPEFVFGTLLSTTRKPLGKPSPRGRPAIAFTDNIDWNLPRGDYALMEFDTAFGSRLVHERLVFSREQGRWKLAGYFFNTRT